MATVEKLENNKMKLTVEIGVEAFDEAIQSAYVKTRGRYNVAGFRKGKAPKRMIENIYGEGVFWEEAFELIYPGAYERAIEELSLEPVEKPSLSIEKIGQGEGVVFTAEFAVRPEVVLGAYKGIEVTRKTYTVEDADVDRLIEQEREKVGRYVEQDRPVENGDRVLLDYCGSVDGEKFDGGAAEDATLDIGSGTFIPGFEEQLIGMQKGEEKVIEVTFPEEYHAEELKGKPASFEVNIKGIQVKELPALDDEFAQDVSGCDTLEALREEKRATLQREQDARAKSEMEDEAISKAAENATFDVPDAMIERQMDYMMQEFSYRLSMSGLNIEDYCRFTGTDMLAMREEYRKEAERRVRTQLVMDAIGKAEQVDASDADVDHELEEYAERAGKTVAEFRETLSEDDLEYFKERCIAQKTIDLIMEHAKLVDAPKEEEKPKKKSRAKAKKPADTEVAAEKDEAPGEGAETE